MPSHAQKRRTQTAHLRSFHPSEVDPHPKSFGVLSDEIIFYAENERLITPFNRDNLKPAGYELTIGDEYFRSGEFLELNADDGDNHTIVIPPFEVAVLKTAEIVCLPRYLIARWNIRVKHAYSGLLWVGGPQVDPGYVGHLFCPIYNLSDKPVTLHVGDPIALIDFVKTTPFDATKPETKLKRYLPAKRLFIEDYGIDDLRSALFTKAGEKLGQFEGQIQNLESRFITFTQISFAIFALVIALVALVSRANAESIALSAAFFGAITISASVAACLIATFSYAGVRLGRFVFEQYGWVMGGRAQSAQRYLRRAWYLSLVICIAFALGGGWGLYRIIEPSFRDFRRQQVLTKSDLAELESSLAASITQDLRAELTALRGELQEVQGRLKQLQPSPAPAAPP